MMAIQQHRLSLERIQRATAIIDRVFLNSPQIITEQLGELFGCRMILKIETLNPIKSFKGRGSDLLAAGLQKSARVMCASAGNFGQAMAWSCRKRGIPISIVAAATANAYKIERMRALGADITLYGDDFDAAKMEARRRAEAGGFRFVEDSADIETLEGAGTIALELLQFPMRFDTVLVALGNGALFNGMAYVIKSLCPATKMIAVQSEGAPAMVESYRSGRMVVYEKTSTIADGIAVRIPVQQALKDMEGLADDTILVSEAAILHAMKLLPQHAGLVAEPSGAVGVAAMLENRELFKGKTVATIICGANLTAEQVERWL
ncbi:MAG TPA: pyridoxal-phosphate dependent enzyme [Chitinophagaceae bacterium]|nr:pyridoxal-phosphate dependent enzyme [Chitinophagaceae bacterium]